MGINHHLMIKYCLQDEVFYNGRIPNKGATTDYFQYIVIIQNSKASTLYKK